MFQPHITSEERNDLPPLTKGANTIARFQHCRVFVDNQLVFGREQHCGDWAGWRGGFWPRLGRIPERLQFSIWDGDCRLGEGWREFVASTDAWLQVIRGVGKAEVERTYRLLLEGKAKPTDGHVLSLGEAR